MCRTSPFSFVQIALFFCLHYNNQEKKRLDVSFCGMMVPDLSDLIFCGRYSLNCCTYLYIRRIGIMERISDHQEEFKDSENKTDTSQYILQSVSNALSVIDLLGKHQQLSVAQVAQAMKLGKTTAFRLLTTLENSGYLCKDSKAQYRLSMKLAVLGSIVTSRTEIANLSHPLLEELSACFRETVHLVTWNSDVDVVVVDRVIGTSPISYQTNVGYITHPAHMGASGQILLAFAEEKRVERYVKLIQWEQWNHLAISSPQDLLELLKHVQKEKTATNDGDAIPGLYCYAVPVFDHKGQAIASLSISGPEANLKEKRVEMIAKLHECSRQIHRQICLGLE